MEEYKRINDCIEDLSKGEVVKKRRSYFFPILCIIIGIAIILFGIFKSTDIGFEQTSYLAIFFGLFLVGWGGVRIYLKAGYYVVKSLNREIKPMKIFIDPKEKESAIELFKTGNLDGIINKSINKSSPLILELWRVDGHQLLYSQLLYKTNSRLNPIMNPLVKKEAKIK